MEGGKRLYVVAIYASDNDLLSRNFISELDSLFTSLRLSSEENYYIIAGDLNSKHIEWGNTVHNTRGTSLHKWLMEHNIEFKHDLLATGIPSYPRRGPYLDRLLIDRRLTVLDVERRTRNCLTAVEYESDHRGLFAATQLPNEVEELEEYVQRQPYNYNTAELRSSGINRPTNRNLTNEEVDRYLVQMDDVIKQTMDKTILKVVQLDDGDVYRDATIDALHDQKSSLLSRLKL